MIPQLEENIINVQINQSNHLQTEGIELQQSIQSPNKVGNFTFSYQNMIGKGSFSKVYRGHHQSNQKHQVAIKVIQKNRLTGDLKILIQSQITILKLVNHPNIVKCYDIKDDENNIYVIMQLCNGGDLQSKVDKNGPMNEDQALPIIKNVFHGLLYLSQQHIIHRDIKVANIFLQNSVAKIADFGFAIHSKSKKQFQDISVGSPIYMSPQGIKHNVYGPTTDVWSFGVFIYQLLHGSTPYSHCTKQKQLKYNISNQIGWYNLKPTLSYSIKQVIYKCLEINYEKRITFQKLKQLDFFQEYDKKISLFKENQQEILQKRLKTMHNKQYSLMAHSFYYEKSLQNRMKLHSVRNTNSNNNFNSPTRLQKKQQLSQKIINSNRRFRSQPNQQDYKESYNRFLAIIKKQNKHQQSPISKKYQKTTKNSNQYQQVNQQQKHHKIKLKTQVCSISPKKEQFSFFNDENRSYYSKKQTFNNVYNKYGQNKYSTKYHMKQQSTNSYNKVNNYLEQHSPRRTIKQTIYQDGIKQSHQKSDSKISLNFPQQNINCYLYIVHFSRLLYKLTCLMQFKPNLDQIKFNLKIFCLSLLQQTIIKIEHYVLHSHINSQDKLDFITINKTLIKYLNQYTNQFNNFTPNQTNIKHDNLININSKLQKQMNNLLSNEIKQQNTKSDTVKLLYLTWVYGQHFNPIFFKYFIRLQSRHWYLYSLVKVIKQIQCDIQSSNTISNLQSYLKIKRKQQLRELS